MKIRVLRDVEAVAQEAGSIVAARARAAIAARGRFVAAFSGGTTPWLMLRAFADEDIPWESVHVFQVDERVAPEGSAERNLTHLRECLLDHAPLRADHVYPMPVEAFDLGHGAAHYAQTLRDVADSPPILDLVHLGLGPDGHTASLVPDDPVLGIADADVAMTGIYQGVRRMTLTYPLLNRARSVLWVVTGAEKVDMLVRLADGDQSIPAGRVNRDRALVLADPAAAAKLNMDVELEPEA